MINDGKTFNNMQSVSVLWGSKRVSEKWEAFIIPAALIASPCSRVSTKRREIERDLVKPVKYFYVKGTKISIAFCLKQYEPVTITCYPCPHLKQDG